MQTVTMPETAAPEISVVVLAWRQTDRLVDCLAALAASESAPPFETVVVLNGASPEVRSIVESRVSGAVLVDIEQNIGFGGGSSREAPAPAAARRRCAS